MGAGPVGESCTADDVLDATERVVGGIEVIDSRYEAFKFTLPDVIADNTSAARVAIGDAGVSPREVDLREVECTFTVDGEVTGRATGAALLGSPAECVAMLVRHLARSDRGSARRLAGDGRRTARGPPVGCRHDRHRHLQPLRRSHSARCLTRLGAWHPVGPGLTRRSIGCLAPSSSLVSGTPRSYGFTSHDTGCQAPVSDNSKSNSSNSDQHSCRAQPGRAAERDMNGRWGGGTRQAAAW